MRSSRSSQIKLAAAIATCNLVFGAGAYADEDLEKILGGESKSVKAKATKGTENSSKSNLVEIVEHALSRPTAEQKEFLVVLGQGDWSKAFLRFDPAFAGTSFANSETGGALRAYLLWQNGLHAIAIEDLFTRVADPKKVELQLLNIWRHTVTESDRVWATVRVASSDKWREVFGPGVEIKLRTRDVAWNKGVEISRDLQKIAPQGTRERAVVDWNLAVALSLKDQSADAAKLIAGVLANAASPMSQDLMHLTAARLLFQNGYLDAAVKYYQSVRRQSDYWVDAQEELGWTYLRAGRPQDTLAVTKSLMVPSLKGWVGPEAYLARSVAQLRVCDYPGVMQTLIDYRENFKPRALALRTLAENTEMDLVREIFERVGQTDLRLEDVGATAQRIPRATIRDTKLAALVRGSADLKKEASAANELYVKSLAETGLQGSMDRLKARAEERSKSAEVAAHNRLKELASRELSQIKTVLDKLQIVEAEVIQQVASASRLEAVKVASADVKVGTTGSKSPDSLKFPVGSEVWFDELGHYKVDVKKGCQAKR